MRLIVEGDTTTVTAIDELERCLEHGSLAVRLTAVAQVLIGIQSAAAAVTPADAPIREADPARMAQMAASILAVASAARALAATAPPGDPNAAVVVQTLDSLQLYPAEQTIQSQVVSITAAAGTYPGFRFQTRSRVVGAYLISNVAESGTALRVSLHNAGSAGERDVAVATLDSTDLNPGIAYPVVTSADADVYEAGDLLTVRVDTNAKASFSVRVDYQAD